MCMFFYIGAGNPDHPPRIIDGGGGGESGPHPPRKSFRRMVRHRFPRSDRRLLLQRRFIDLLRVDFIH